MTVRNSKQNFIFLSILFLFILNTATFVFAEAISPQTGGSSLKIVNHTSVDFIINDLYFQTAGTSLFTDNMNEASNYRLNHGEEVTFKRAKTTLPRQFTGTPLEYQLLWGTPGEDRKNNKFTVTITTQVGKGEPHIIAIADRTKSEADTSRTFPAAANCYISDQDFCEYITWTATWGTDGWIITFKKADVDSGWQTQS